MAGLCYLAGYDLHREPGAARPVASPSLTPSMKTHKHKSLSHDSFALTSFPSRRRDSFDSDEEIVNPNVDASFSPTHFTRHEEQQKGGTTTLRSPGILRRIFEFMSHTPLLSSPSQASHSYGIVPGIEPNDNAVESEDKATGRSTKNQEKGKSSALGTKFSTRRPSSRRDRVSTSQERLNVQNPDGSHSSASDRSQRQKDHSSHSPDEDDGTEESASNEDENVSSWSEESPPDNSS